MGVRVETIMSGDGVHFPRRGDRLKVHYVGILVNNGKKFDSSRDKDRVFEFVIGIGQVIRGWDDGIMKMSLGERAFLHISSDFGYGAEGAGDIIPPDADLLFEVELLDVNGTAAPGAKTEDACSGPLCTIM